jgi:hypothetical protein
MTKISEPAMPVPKPKAYQLPLLGPARVKKRSLLLLVAGTLIEMLRLAFSSPS